MISDSKLRTYSTRVWLTLIVMSIVITLFFGSGSRAQESSNVIDFIELEGVIDPVSSRYLLRMLDRASSEGSNLVIVQLDTPGGLDISMREMVQKILASRVPVVVWVAPAGARAASAGVFITYAAHIASMSPATNVGAAHPVNLGGEADETSTEKAVEDAVAYLESIARLRNRNVEWAEDAIRESASIDAERALELNVVDLNSSGLSDLLRQIDGRTIRITPEGGLGEDTDAYDVTISTQNYRLVFHKMGLFERILHTVVRPEIAYMLLILGFYGLIFELYNPGIGAAGVLGGTSLILGLYALSILPTSWAGVALLVLAFVFFVVDLHVAGLGVFTLGGVVSLLAGSLLLFSGASPELRLAWWAIGGAVAGSLLFFIGVMTAAIRARIAQPVSGSEGLVGTFGSARTDIAPEGQVMARGTLWRARTAGMAIGQGSRVRILGVSGLVLMVEQAEAQLLEEEGSRNGRAV